MDNIINWSYKYSNSYRNRLAFLRPHHDTYIAILSTQFEYYFPLITVLHCRVLRMQSSGIITIVIIATEYLDHSIYNNSLVATSTYVQRNVPAWGGDDGCVVVSYFRFFLFV